MGKDIRRKRKQGRRELVEQARTLFRRSFPDLEEGAAGTCLYWAACILAVTQRTRHLRLVPQAGTAAFRIVPESSDDGVSHTHFSYEWQGPEHSQLKQLPTGQLILPEIHVWAGDPQKQHVVDLTVGFQKEQCEVITGMTWQMPDPPPYVWDNPAKLAARGFIYKADSKATHFALGIMRENIFPQLRRD